MICAIPFLVRRSSGDNGIGAAFLARKAGAIKLVTCAHTATSTQPTLDFTQWPAAFELMSRQQWLPLPYFSNGTANFSFKVREEDYSMADAIAYNLTAEASKRLASEYRVFEMNQALDCEKDQKIIAYGYPDTDLNVWPPKVQLAKGKVLDNKIRANMTIQPGFSGGPVVAHGDNLAGMAIGSNALGQAKIITAQFINRLFEQ